MRPTWLSRLKPIFWVLAVLLIGVGLRAYHYLRGPSLWHDEAALVLNVLDRGYLDLLGPLTCHEAAPPGFLWLEHTASLLFGDSLLSLRFLPWLASLAALPLLAVLAWRLLPPPAVPWVVLLFAASDRLLWHCCEAKPYALDVLAALAVVLLFHQLRPWPLTRQLLLYTLLAPPLIFTVYPGCFLCGGLLLALLPALPRERRLGPWLAYGLLILVVGGSFWLLLTGPIRAQRCGPMDSCWLNHFPPLQRPWRLPDWIVFSTLDVVYYCFKPVGHVLGLLALLGAVQFWRDGRRPLVILLVTPLALALAASFLNAYPYGGARVEVFAAPALVLLVGAGLMPAFAWLRRRAAVAPAALALVLLAPLAFTLRGVADPWERADCGAAADHVLARRRTDEAILANHWEYEYYFRRLGPQFRRVDGPTAEDGGRVWLVLSGVTAGERQRLCELVLSGDWRLVERQEFCRTSVFLLEKAPAPGPAWPVALRAVH